VSGDAGRIWLIVGCLGLLVSLGELAMNIDAYIRHMDSGDQAGFGLGMMFLVTQFLPATAAALVLGAVPARPALGLPLPARDRVRSAIAFLLRVGAVALFAFVTVAGALGSASEFRSTGTRVGPAVAAFVLSLATMFPLIAFGGLLWGCALAVTRPATARSPWLVAAIVITMVAEGVFVAGLSGSGSPAAILQAVLVMGGPAVAYVLVALRTLWIIRRLPASG
jgi:hypothetical protein